MRLQDYLDAPEERLWYARQTIEHGWSRNVLVHQIESDLYACQGKAITNFERALPPPQSDLARQLLKSPYNFEFLTLRQDAEERMLEKGLLDHIRKFLLELGQGFAFLGSQYHIEFDDEDYFLDLLFYHVKLRCYIVIDLKTGRFKPEYAGKMNFYLAVVDDLLRHPDDSPSIGLILCKEKKSLTVEYSLCNTSTPIGVSEYRITETLPEALKTSLPTVEQLAAEFASMELTRMEEEGSVRDGRTIMAKKDLTPSHRAYIEQTLANVERKRSQPLCGADVQHILEQMQSENEVIRTNAVRQIRPCRMPWEVFDTKGGGLS